MEFPNFVGPSYVSQSPIADQEELINWYVENMESPGATVRTALYPTPGVSTLSTAAQGPGLAHFEMTGREFAVIGPTFYEINTNGTLTSRGTVALGSTPATISSNGNAGGQIMITAGGNVYIFTLGTNAFAQVAAMNGLATMGDQIDGYFLVLNANNATVYFSNLLDGTTWQTGTNFFQRNAAPDAWVALKVLNRFIWIFGAQTSEVWYDAGTFPIPFALYPSGVVPYGCGAQFSPVVANGSLVWLGKTKAGQNQVLRTTGFSPTIISTYPIELLIDSFTTARDAVGDSYTDLGHTHYLLSFPTANVTLCFDANTNFWHKRLTWISEKSQYVAWRPRFHAFANGQHRMLDGSTGAVYQMSSNFTTDVDMRSIRRMRRTPAMFYQNQRLFFKDFELDLEPGLGNAVDPGSNPQVMMRMSNDGGKTWGTEHMRSAGAIGKYATRVRWNRGGTARRRVYEVTTTDSIPWRVMNAYIGMRQPPLGISSIQKAQFQL